MKKRIIIGVTAFVLVFCFVIGGSIAWLLDKTDPVKNTFTYGDINISLSESDDLDLKMVPGNDIKKDPKVTVAADSEACWLFVKVEKSDNYTTYLADCTIESSWTKLEDGVYYREVDGATAKAGAEYSVLKDNKVTVLESVTKEMMKAIKDKTAAAPTLTFTAYAIQKDGFATAQEAWTEVSKEV